MSNYSISRLDSQNLKHLYTLFAEVYRKKCKANYFEVKYNTGYTGAEFIGYLAFNEDYQPVAYYGVVPTLVSVTKKKVLAAQSCDTMTHPNYRNKGLFTDLAKRTFELAKQQGIHFIFGFPNQNSYPGFIQKLGFTHTETMNRYNIRFSNTIFKFIYRKTGLIKLKKTSSFILNPLLNEGFDGVVYNKDYIKHKTYGSNAIIKKGNHSFWVTLTNNGWVGTIDPLSKESVQSLIPILESLVNTPSLTFMVSPDTAMDKALTKNYKPEPGFAIITKNLTNTYSLDNLKFQFSDIDIF